MTASASRAPSGGALAFFVLVLLLTALELVARYLPNTWINRDGRFYTNVNVTLTESLSFDQGEFCASWYDGQQGWNRQLDAGWSNVAVGRDDRRLPKHPVLLPLLSTPLFWAFGLHGNLLFNLLAVGFAGLFAFCFARRYASAPAAGAAALAFLLGTGIRDYAYDYHVDILLLALFLGGVVALQARRGWVAGVLIGACVTLKPTVLVWAPSLLLIAPWRRAIEAAVSRAVVDATVSPPLVAPPASASPSPGAPSLVTPPASATSSPGAPSLVASPASATSSPGAPSASTSSSGAVASASASPARSGVAVLLRAVGGGALVLTVYALANWYFFGKPWWAGYNRVLVVVDGTPQVLDVASTFDVPWDAGLQAVWKGPYGVRDRLTFALFALPGLLVLWRRPAYVLATLLALAAGVLVFARYQWYSDRFLWPAFALLLPAAAALLDAGARMARRLGATLRARVARPSAAVGAGLACALVVAATLPGGPPIEHRLPDDAWSLGGAALARGSFDLRAVASEARLHAPDHPVRLGRGELWAARQSPLATVVAAPFAAGGTTGLIALHLALVFILGWALTRASGVSGPLASAAALGFVLLPGVAHRLVAGGPALLAAALGVLALALVRPRRFFLAGLLGALAAGVASAPWPFALGVIALAIPRGGPALLRASGGVVLGLVLVAGTNLAVLGDLGGDLFVNVPSANGGQLPSISLEALLERATHGEGRAMLGLALFGVLALFARPPGTAAVGVAMASAALLPSVARTSEGALPLVALALLALGLPAVAGAVGRALAPVATLRPRAHALLALALFGALGVTGVVTRVVAEQAPLRFATYRGLRAAKVSLGRTPCDFLNWQNLAWECSTKDRSVLGMVGLGVTEPIFVGGERRTLLLVPNEGAWNRKVRWEGVEAGPRFFLRWAVPDHARGGATLVVTIDGEERARVPLPLEPDGRLRTERIDTAALVGRAVDVELELLGVGAGVAVDGGFYE
ncbi:MAG: DUF2029 domain-containing protein [Myxococcales bacterium]|nr:DUF2029 domain-containing protein [Myxococcales bacterium]